MDIIDTAPAGPRGPRLPRTAVPITVALSALVIILAVTIGALQWWGAQSERPDRLEIVEIEQVGPFAISGDDLPPDWPAGLVAGALLLRLDITANPQRSTLVDSSGDIGAYVASGVSGMVVPAGERAQVNVVITPGDCGGIETAELAGPLMDAGGTHVPLAAAPAQALRGALAALCPDPASEPAISVRGARIDVFFRDRTLVMRLRVTTPADRVVLQPLDSVGFRGRGEQDATIEDGVATSRLRWLVSPAEAVGLQEPTVRVRAFAIVAGRAYPWLLDLRVPEGAVIPAPSRPRNDGVDLAEVAPRPAS